MRGLQASPPRRPADGRRPVCSAEDSQPHLRGIIRTMRNFGGILLLLGVLGFFYSSSQIERLEPVPAGKTVSESLEYPSGRWEMVRYACAGAGFIGVLLALFPKGR